MRDYTLKAYISTRLYNAITDNPHSLSRLSTIMTPVTPMTTTASQYDILGGDSAVRQLVDRFYDLMDTREDVKKLRSQHAKSLRVSREKLYLFLSGWLVLLCQIKKYQRKVF